MKKNNWDKALLNWKKLYSDKGCKFDKEINIDARVIMKKKIAILGSSPIMLMFAKKLSKNNIVHVYEKRKNIGGAWQIHKYKNLNFHAYTNIVSPLKPKDEKYYSLVNRTLKNQFGVKIKKNLKSYSSARIDSKGNVVIKKRNIKDVFEYNFDEFFKKMKKSLKIKKKKLENIKIFRNGVNIENIYYDKLYITAFAGIKKIFLNNKKKIQIPFDKRTSSHMIIVANKEFIKNFYYSETFSDIFDRVQLIKIKKFYVFTARVSNEFKKKSIKKILNLSDFNLKKKNILLAKKINFNNHYRTPEQVKKMINDLKFFRQIKVINTSQLFYAYKKEILNV
jgi:hypothetical protein